MKGKILIVDDNNELLLAYKMILVSEFELVKTISNPDLIFSELRKNTFDIILLDMNYRTSVNSGNEGFYWMRKIKDIDPLVSIVLITAYSNTDLAIKAIKEGAYDFIEKSWDESKIISTLINAIEKRKSNNEIIKLKRQQRHLNRSLNSETSLIGKSKSIKNIISLIHKVAPTQANILILGENGTGKEIAARQIHTMSTRKDNIFVKVDVGALSESLFESELFGYKKGAFTDAKEDKIGQIEIASGGTLFLDEIGNIPINLQAKLLSVLQNREVLPIGATKPITIDVRLICATNIDIDNKVDENEFREDLLYRINTIQIELPPLRSRNEDVPLFASFFLNKYIEKYNKKNMKFTHSAIDKLSKQKWPGNIRELQHTIEKAVILCEGKIISHDDIFLNRRKLTYNTIETYNLAENEKKIISIALEKIGNITLVAKQLGINRSTLYDKIKKYGL